MDEIGLKQQFRKRALKGVDGCKGVRLVIDCRLSRRWRPSLRQKQKQMERLLPRLQNRGQGKSKQGQKRGETSSKDHQQQRRVALLNPISGHEIALPGSPISRSDYECGPRFVLSPSHSHLSTPCYTVFIIFNSSKLLFFCKGDRVWTRLNLPWDPDTFNTFKGNLYALRASEGARYLLDVYTYTTEPSHNDEENQPTSTIEKFGMDTSQLPPPNTHEFFVHHLVESPNGEELLLVLEIIEIGHGCGELTFLMLGFQVFTADLSGMMWIRKETLGDHVLIIKDRQTLFLSAASVGNGIKGNCIYFSEETEQNPLKMFDLDSEKVTDYPFSIPFNAGQFMFTPSTC